MFFIAMFLAEVAQPPENTFFFLLPGFSIFFLALTTLICTSYLVKI